MCVFGGVQLNHGCIQQGKQGIYMPLHITITDPRTIALFHRYRQYLERVQEVEGTIEQVAELCMYSSLDEDHEFQTWCQEVESTVPRDASGIELAPPALSAQNAA